MLIIGENISVTPVGNCVQIFPIRGKARLSFYIQFSPLTSENLRIARLLYVYGGVIKYKLLVFPLLCCLTLLSEGSNIL